MRNKIKGYNTIFWGLLAAEIILLIYSVCGLYTSYRNRIYLEYDYTNLVLNSGYADSERQLTYIDSAYAFKGYFAYTAPVPVNKGRYHITIEYRSQASDNGIEILNAGASSFDKVKMDEITLSPDKNSVSFYVWVKEDLEKFQLASVYNGEGEFEIIRMAAVETRTQPLIDLLKLVLICLAVDAVYIMYNVSVKNNRTGEFEKNCYIAVMLAGVILFSSMPLMNGFLIKGSDMEFHMLRIEGLKEGLLSGQFPVRIQPIQLNGYGYPVSMFYGDLFLYPSALLRILGIAVQDCYKLLLFFLNAATCIIMYGCANGIFKDRKTAVFAALLYTLVPYRLNSLYVRAAVGEITAYAFLPLIVYGLYRIFAGNPAEKDYKNGFVYAVAGYTGVINSHILTCEFVGLFTIVTCLLLIKKTFEKIRFMQLLKTLVVSLMLNAFFLCPFIDMMTDGGVYVLEKYTFTGQFIQGQGLNPASLFDIFPSGNGIVYNNSLKEYGMYGMKGEEGMTVGIGLIILMMLAFIYCIYHVKDENGHREINILGIICGIIGLLTLYMSLNIFPWDRLEHAAGRLVSNIQFPWRILAISSVTGVFASCVYLRQNGERAKEIAAAAAFLCLISSGWCMHERLYENTAYYVYDTMGLDTTMTGSGSWNEYIPTETEVELLNKENPDVSSGINITAYEKRYTNISMYVNAENSGFIEVPLLFYKGYEALGSDGNKLTVSAGSNNAVRVDIPQGYTGSIEIRYEGMFLWKLADMLSLLTLIIIFPAILIYGNKNTKL